MNEDCSAQKNQEDLVLSHSIVNYLSAGYQGRYTFFNILARLEFTDLKKEPIAELKDVLKSVRDWNNDMQKGLCLFSATWSSPQTFDAKRAFKLLENLKQDLLQATVQLVTLLSVETKELDDDMVKILIASHGRFAYARENYVRGFVDFSALTKNQELAEQYKSHLEGCAADIKLAHDLMQLMKDLEADDREEFVASVKYHCLSLPGAFRAQALDISILLATYAGEISFETAGVNQENAEKWKAMDALASVAGYWESFGIGPDEALGWSKIGVADHELAATWRLHGFTHESARAWLESGIPPIIALSWHSAGFSPEHTSYNLKEGITDPAEGRRPALDEPEEASRDENKDE